MVTLQRVICVQLPLPVPQVGRVTRALSMRVIQAATHLLHEYLAAWYTIESAAMVGRDSGAIMQRSILTDKYAARLMTVACCAAFVDSVLRLRSDDMSALARVLQGDPQLPQLRVARHS